MLFFLFFALSHATSITPQIASDFQAFQHKYGKTYSSEEFVKRLGIFAENVAKVEIQNKEHVAMGGEKVFGITKFMDLTSEEFASIYLTAKSSNTPNSEKYDPPMKVLADKVDWVAKGATTKVKDQGDCGSCWAFSAVDAIESYAYLNGSYDLIELSPQQVNACDKTDDGCNGGDTLTAYQYVKKAGGIETEKDYPYTSGNSGRTGICKFSKEKVAVQLKGYVQLKENEPALKVGVNSGPVSVCLAAAGWQTYNKGILKLCPSPILDHCVQVVGYDDTDSTPYWRVRNSWNTDWGEEGYIRLEQGKNICRIANEASYPTF